MEPLSILLKMACKTQGPRWPHSDVHACFKLLKETHVFWKKELNFGLLGALFLVEARQHHHLLCTEQSPAREKDVSTLLLFFYVLFPNFSKSMCSRKTRWHTFSGFFPASHLYKANATSYPLKLESKPWNNIFRNINTIGEDYTVKFGKEIK